MAYGGREIGHTEYQVLVNPHGTELAWEPASDGQLPHGAVQGGVTGEGEPLFIGRVEHAGSWQVGKIHPSHGVLYISFGGNEVPHPQYEVLCTKTVNL